VEATRPRIAITAVLVAVCCFLTYYFNMVLAVDILFSHLFYLPTVLACIWWKRRGLIVAVFLAAQLVLWHSVSRGEVPIADDFVRGAVLVAVALVVAMLSERIAKTEETLQKSHNQLEAKVAERKKAEQQLRMSLKEKEALLQELHHRVNNNLQVISSMLGMSMLRLRDQQAIDLCADARARVHTMALVHSQLYGSQRLDQVSMAGYVRQLVDYLLDVYAKEERITSVVEASGVYLSMAQAIPCALVLNELVSNALKHAFKGGQEGRIEISMQRSAGGVVSLKVKDDGSGIPDNIDIYKANTLGLKLARNLVEKQLRGQIHLERNEGAEFVIEFNAPQEEA